MRRKTLRPRVENTARATEGSSRVGAIQAIPGVLRSFGLRPAQILAEVGVTPSLFASPDNLISDPVAGRLFRLCAERTGCQHFGLLVGRKAGLASLGFVGLLARHAPDVGTGLRTINRYLNLNDGAAIATLSDHGALAMWTYAIYEPGLVGTDQVYQSASAVACNILREFCGRELSPEEVLIPRSRPRDIRPYRSFYRAPVRFDADQLAVVFARSWLDGHIRGADPAQYRTLMQQAAALDAKVAASLPFLVRRVLRRLTLSGKGSIGDVAAVFAIHRRTLDRQLDAHGVSFRRLADEVRFEVSRQLLRDTQMPISDIAMALHYANASAFATAFRRWSGTTPSAWRSQSH